MSNKRKLASILGICGATVLASGGSIFLTDTGLALLEKDQQIVQETESESGEKETDAPITVEQFAKTKDSFVVSVKKTTPVKEKETEKKSETETDESNNTASNAGSSSGGNTSSGGNAGTSSDNSGSGSGSNSGIRYDENGGYYDSNGNYYDGNGGYYAPNGNYYSSDGTYSDPYGNWYDGSGGYYDPSGNYHKGTYDPDSGSSGGGSSDGGSSDDGSSDDGSSNGGSTGWDDSYMMYDINERYISADELSDWSSSDLAKLRNEIFARHGRIFTTQKWADYIATKSWYVPTYDASYFDDNMGSFLNDYEWKNLNVILKLEDQRG